MDGAVRSTIMAAPILELNRRRWTVDEYWKMAEDGILHPDDRVELLDGDVVMMSPIGPHHGNVVDALTGLLVPRLQGIAVVRVQGAIQLDEYSQPQPDLALLRRREGGYREDQPRPGDIFLVIEVAKTSLTTDLEVKVPLYARAGIPEVWVIDLDNAVLLAHRDPAGDRYASVESYRADAEVTVAKLPRVSLALEEILDE
jgi:Uma2 family endonuclease